MSACLVTGGAGFIGSHLVEGLLAHGHEVVVLDNFSTGHLGNLAGAKERIRIIQGDITNLETVKQAVDGVSLVFHLAGLPSVPHSIDDPVGTHEVIAKGTLHVLLAARDSQVQRVIYSSSMMVYGDCSGVPKKESDPLAPTTPYAVATLAAEYYCAAFTFVHGLETVRLRYANVFGPRQAGGASRGSVVPTMIESMLAGQRPVIQGDGLQDRDFTCVDDVVQANLLAAEAPRVSGRVYNIGSGRATKLLTLVEKLNTILGSDLRPIHTMPRAGDVHSNRGDTARAMAELGYCTCTDLVHGLNRCLEYYSGRRRGPKRAGRPSVSIN